MFTLQQLKEHAENLKQELENPQIPKGINAPMWRDLRLEAYGAALAQIYKLES